MPLIEVKHVISFTSQDPKHPVKDLVEGRGPWLNEKGDKSKSLQADLQLEKATKISYIDIGNAGSVMIGVEVGRSAWPINKPYLTLIPKLTFMTRAEVTSGQNKNSVRMFNSENMEEKARNEEWDRVRILCVQPFSSPSQFGLSMLKMYSGSKVTPKTQLTSPWRDLAIGVTLNKKNELMAKLKLSNPENKSGLCERVKMMESSQLPDGRVESAMTHHPNSPLSRGAQLVTLAAKIPTQQENVVKKSELEHEGLRFLMSLNLSVSEIDSISIKDIRQNFEKKRQKPLTSSERKVFRDIAVDYAMRRLEILENQDTAAHLAARGVRTSEVPGKIVQQKRKFEHSSIDNTGNQELNNGCSSVLKSNLPVQGSKSLKRLDEKNQVDKPVRKFTFGQSKGADSPLGVQGQKTDKQEAQSSRFFKNSTTPGKKLPKTRRLRKTVTKQVEQQSLLGQWITPMNKMKVKEKEKKFQHSTIVNVYDDSDDSDIGCIIEEDSDLSSTSRRKSSSFSLHKSPLSTSGEISGAPKGSHLGAAPNNKFNMIVRGARESASPSYQKQQLIDCPLCFEPFPAKDIEAHAAFCSVTSISSDNFNSDDGGISVSSEVQPSTSGLVEECPVCGVQVAAAKLESHATLCASNLLD